LHQERKICGRKEIQHLDANHRLVTL